MRSPTHMCLLSSACPLSSLPNKDRTSDSLGGTELDLDKSLEERGSDLSRLTDAACITAQSVYSCCLLIRLNDTSLLVTGRSSRSQGTTLMHLPRPQLISTTRFGYVHEDLVLVAETWTTCSDNTDAKPGPRTAHRHFYQASDPATGRPGTHLAAHSPPVRKAGSKRHKTSGHQRESKLG
ncbi:predicted protein [Verticillium alfalfae VaMs.102]|uniref:Predicted protein n=1 Tax=Verticillium alfalfae (strain VaMs.102 / ATCC MYA-4576 / FGSC 10136) TaxID=526221 RepID=C9SMB6_VERA1|nr:predicted protein [Verticillium alfalfae VaMs.102]EEY19931.1 predicted protein [Verticillium alfalfae VaMs.102]